MSNPLHMLARGAPLATLLAVAVTTTAIAQNGKLTRKDLLVTSEWLATQLDNPKLVLFHIGEKPEYEAGHIPGARFLELQDVSSPMTMDTTKLALEMLPPDELRHALEQLGISDDSRIVVYYGQDWVSPATRIVFTLDHAGLGSRTSLLDGGMQAWIAAGNAVTKEKPTLAAGRLSPLRT